MFCKKIGRECKFFDYCQGDKLVGYKNPNNFFDRNNGDKGSEEEELLFNLGLKFIFKYEKVLLDNLEKFIGELDFERDFHLGVFSILEESTYYKDYLTNNNYVSVFIAENKSIINKYLHYDTNPNYKIRILGTGKLLGYPDCCTKNAVKQCSNINSMEEFENNNWINRFECPLVFGPVRLYAHFACSEKCIATIEYSEKVLSKLYEQHGEKIIKDYFFINKI